MPLALLFAIAELAEEDLRRGLGRLQTAEFLYETRLFPDLEYTFKHALTHAVAYSNLLQERRRSLHARIVEILEALHGDHLAEQLEPLAHHAYRGEQWEKAVRYARLAGDAAGARSAHRQVIELYQQAIQALAHMPQGREALLAEVELRYGMRNAQLAAGDLDPIPENLRRALTVADTLDAPRSRSHWPTTTGCSGICLMPSSSVSKRSILPSAPATVGVFYRCPYSVATGSGNDRRGVREAPRREISWWREPARWAGRRSAPRAA